MNKWLSIGLLLPLLGGCSEMDESMLITDDQGTVHRTINYLRDKRGRDYFPVHIKGTGKRLFVFDPKAYAWAAYDEQGQRLLTGAATGGKDFCEDVGQPCRTVTGSFRLYNKRGLECRSGEFPVETKGGTRMPYCMYFYQGFTVHAGFEIPYGNVSHGCVRVWPSAAKWLNEEFMRIGTDVTVLSYADEDEIREKK